MIIALPWENSSIGYWPQSAKRVYNAKLDDRHPGQTNLVVSLTRLLRPTSRRFRSTELAVTAFLSPPSLFGSDCIAELHNAISELRTRAVQEMRPAIDDRAIEGLKFSECLPITLTHEMLDARPRDSVAVRETLALQLRSVASQ